VLGYETTRVKNIVQGFQIISLFPKSSKTNPHKPLLGSLFIFQLDQLLAYVASWTTIYGILDNLTSQQSEKVEEGTSLLNIGV
jgi:hypothetical protein